MTKPQVIYGITRIALTRHNINGNRSVRLAFWKSIVSYIHNKV